MKQTAIKGLVALTVVVCLCMFFSGTIKTIATAKVMIVTARQGRIEEQIRLNGTLLFPETEDIGIAGLEDGQSVSIKRVRVTKGRQVEEGDVLFEAEVTGSEEKMAELRSTYDTAQKNLMELNRANSGLRLTHVEEQWIEAYDALNEAKRATRDARMQLEVCARLLGVQLVDGEIPEGDETLAEDEDFLAAREAFAAAQQAEAEAQQAYDSANRIGISESVVEYIDQSREYQQQMDKAQEDMVALSVLCEQAKSITAPHDGFIVDVSIKSGDTYTGQTAALVMSADDAKGVLRADVSDIERTIEEKTDVSIERSNGRSVSASVTGTGIDTEGKNYVDVELSDREISNLGGASTLMNNDIEMVLSYRSSTSSTLLPVSAVRGTGDGRYVFVINESQNGLGQRVLTVSQQDVTVIAEVGSTASIEQDLSRQRIAYMEDRAISDGSEVMPYEE